MIQRWYSEREICNMTHKFDDVVKTGIEYTMMSKLKVTKCKCSFTVPRPASPTKKSAMPRWLRKPEGPDKLLDKSPTTSAGDQDGCGDGKKASYSLRTPSPSSSLVSRLQTTPILESLRRTLSSSSLPEISTPKEPVPAVPPSSARLTVNLDDIQDEPENAANVSLDAAPPSPTPPPDEVSDSAHLSSDAAKKSRKKNIACWFPERTEAQLAEWYQENPKFYDRKRRDYKDSEKKRKLLKDKAKDIDTTCKYLLIFDFFYIDC